MPNRRLHQRPGVRRLHLRGGLQRPLGRQLAPHGQPRPHPPHPRPPQPRRRQRLEPPGPRLPGPGRRAHHLSSPSSPGHGQLTPGVVGGSSLPANMRRDSGIRVTGSVVPPAGPASARGDTARARPGTVLGPPWARTGSSVGRDMGAGNYRCLSSWRSPRKALCRFVLSPCSPPSLGLPPPLSLPASHHPSAASLVSLSCKQGPVRPGPAAVGRGLLHRATVISGARNALEMCSESPWGL